MTNDVEHPLVEQEHIRLVSGYNDIFVAIACAITFVSLTALIAQPYVRELTLLAAAAGLSWFFVRRQRMRFTGIVNAVVVALVGLSFGFVWIHGGVADDWRAETFKEVLLKVPDLNWTIATAFVTSAALSIVYWWYARVPIAHGFTVVSLILAILTMVADDRLGGLLEFRVLAASFLCGCAAVAYAIWWDVRDPQRQTVATDVALWTHIFAAPFIVQPLYWWSSKLAWNPASEVVIGLLLFFLLLVFALAINRRALLIGAMAWVLAALFTVTDMAVAGLTLGLMLLGIAATWNPVRQLTLPTMPNFVRKYFPVLTSE